MSTVRSAIDHMQSGTQNHNACIAHTTMHRRICLGSGAEKRSKTCTTEPWHYTNTRPMAVWSHSRAGAFRSRVIIVFSQWNLTTSRAWSSYGPVFVSRTHYSNEQSQRAWKGPDHMTGPVNIFVWFPHRDRQRFHLLRHSDGVQTMPQFVQLCSFMYIYLYGDVSLYRGIIVYVFTVVASKAKRMPWQVLFKFFQMWLSL